MSDDKILEVRHLNQWFISKKFNEDSRKHNQHKTEYTQWLRDISFNVMKDEVFGIVGESGCGKSTLAKCIVGLNRMIDGQIIFKGKNISEMSKEEVKIFRKNAQIIFQNPRSALSMNMRVENLIKEAVGLVCQEKTEIDDRVNIILKDMDLADDRRREYPHKLSGGERRRAGLGRILAVRPTMIIADEPVASLDVSYKGKIIELLLKYKKETGATIVLICHDINLINTICDRVAVMFLGKIIEIFAPKYFSIQNHHPYTKELYFAANYFQNCQNENILEGNLTDAGSLSYDGVGCCYQERCQEKKGTKIHPSSCDSRTPPQLKITGIDQQIACFANQEDDQTTINI